MKLVSQNDTRKTSRDFPAAVFYFNPKYIFLLCKLTLHIQCQSVYIQYLIFSSGFLKVFLQNAQLHKAREK